MFNQNWLQEATRFTKKDRLGALFFVLVIGASLLLPHLLAPVAPPLSLQPDSSLQRALDTLQQQPATPLPYHRQEYSRSSYNESSAKGFTEGELFAFDPNTASLQDWLRLGLNEKTSRTILNYTGKGGKFYKADDLQKIWGMPPGFFERVKGQVVITSVERKTYAPYNTTRATYEREERKPVVLNINEADTTDFIALPGIGSKLSARIISFREKLGGFYSVEQIGETYGLPDSTFQKIKGRLRADGAVMRKINVNTATKDALKVHPYIRWNLANALVEYRNQHGAFKSLESLKNVALVDEAVFEKIIPYLDL